MHEMSNVTWLIVALINLFGRIKLRWRKLRANLIHLRVLNLKIWFEQFGDAVERGAETGYESNKCCGVRF
ncbi:MAG: hypothetical protein A2Z87_04210 [Gallionellales bacterium GWA2_54_124]|nr:MAG: hypothetical protein A2Z87_04210 [Gallionellales bacterium GWA2_54_124]